MGCSISGLHDGTFNFKVFLFFFISNPKSFKIFKISLFFTSKPVIFLINEESKFIILFLIFSIF